MASSPATAYKSGLEWLGACRLYARRHAPCLTAGFLAMVVREVPGLGTMGVTKDGKLLFDPELRRVWTVKQGATVLFHELWHLLRRHADRIEKIGPSDYERALWNCAADAEINDDYPKTSSVWDLPDTTVDGRKFEPVTPGNLFRCVGEPGGMPEGQMAESYFEALRDRAKNKKGQGTSDQKGKGEGEGEGGGEEDEDSKHRMPRCGSGAGNPLPNEPKPDGKERTSAEIERVRKVVAEAIRSEATNNRGSVPGGWTVWAEAQLTPPKIPWQAKLAKITRGTVEWAAGQVDYRYCAPSRRQAGVGFGPGRPILPCLRAPKPEVLVAVDTSGSMGKDELTTALSEVKGVLNSTAASVTFAACDAAVHEIKRIRTWQEVVGMMKGGGGTDFTPVFDAAAKLKPRPNVVIFATDGDGTCPAEAPVGMKVIWLLTGKHVRSPCTWGEHIRMDD